jgi:hypothetical protein
MSQAWLDTGKFTSGRLGAWLIGDRPKKYPAVVACHGLGQTPAQITGYNGFPNWAKLIAAIADAGFPIVAPDFSALWGAGASDSYFTDSITFARANLGASSDPPFFIGGSMGADIALHDAKSVGPAGVSGVMCVIPAVDLEGLRTNNAQGARASIDTAWGSTGWLLDRTPPLPAGANPYDNSANYLPIPLQLWYATDDTVSVNIATFATNTGADLRSVGALGHTDTAIGAVPISEALRFFKSRMRVQTVA